MIGIPTQEEWGISVRTLLYPRIRIGALVRLNSSDVVQVYQQNPSDPVRFDRFSPQFGARVLEGDGLYRVYSVEHIGDTHGNDWCSDLVLLAVDMSSKKVIGGN